MEVNKVYGKVVIPYGKIRIELDSFPALGERRFVPASGLVDHPGQDIVGACLTRIGLRPCLTGLSRLFQVSRYQRVVAGSNKEFLPIAGAIPQLPGSAGAFGREIGLIEIGVDSPQRRMCHGECGIDFRGTSEERQSSRGTCVVGANLRRS